MDQIKFELNEVETIRAAEFKALCETIMDIKKGVKGGNVSFNYRFFPSPIGNSVEIHCTELDIGIDITDGKSW